MGRGYTPSKLGGLETLLTAGGGAIAGALIAAPTGVGIPMGAGIGALGGLLLKVFFQSKAFVILIITLIIIFMLGGATIFAGMPWWVIVGLILIFLIIFSRK